MNRNSPFPAASYARLYDSSLGSLWSSERGLEPREDGDHYSADRDFFEWWYFDAAFDNGYRLVAILHSSLFNAVDHKPTVDIRLTPPSERSQIAIGRYARGEYRSTADRCDLQIGGCSARALPDSRYALRLRQGAIEADLIFEGQLPGWRPGNGYLFADEASQRFFKWTVPLPLARVSGCLSLEGKMQEVKGLGYHDHNWGNLVLADAFHHWYWGRIFPTQSEAGWAFTFGDLVGYGPDPPHVRPVFLAVDGKIVSGMPEVTLRSNEYLQEASTGIFYPQRLDLGVQWGRGRTNLSLQNQRVMEAVEFAAPSFRRKWPRQAAETAFYLSMDKSVLGRLARRLIGKAGYLRLQATAQVGYPGIDGAPASGEAIFELMQFSSGGEI